MRVGIAGLGTVGGSIYRILKERGEEIEKRVGERFIVSKVINRSPQKYEVYGVPPEEIAFDFDDLILNSDVVIEPSVERTWPWILLDEPWNLEESL
ncbi:hypothetical protein [Thermotoga neapolitana]|uniref:hypothetical protein n=1 Tax=Thermotoga neapolitana TaxID=2337 RepID=UPI000A83D635|nr:hypothetical protein [Thermotoga neapolitana]